jgi:hypothetical protein
MIWINTEAIIAGVANLLVPRITYKGKMRDATCYPHLAVIPHVAISLALASEPNPATGVWLRD